MLVSLQQMMRENSRIKIQKNLLDTHVSLCSVNVSMLFTENVDHQTRDDFIRGTLVDEEVRVLLFLNLMLK